MAEFETAILIQDLPEGKVIIERANGERWRLDAKKGWCKWAWKYEGKEILLQFGEVTSLVSNAAGEQCEFWTEEQLR